jgi:hypothetical protein
MIQYDKDGVTLYYFDANGNKVAHSYLEGAAYDEMLQVRGAQLQAQTENMQAVSDYNTKLANAQVSVSAGRTADAPQKPLQHLVSDKGESTYVPFVPPLKDLVPLVVNATGDGKIAVVVPDRQAIMYNMIQAMFRKMFPDV